MQTHHRTLSYFDAVSPRPTQSPALAHVRSLQTAHNLYLVFDLCTGGELFDRICAKGNYYEQDAADLIRIILKSVQYIHSCGIVHRGKRSGLSR